MSQGKGYAPRYRETSSMVTLAGTMAESIWASGTLDKKESRHAFRARLFTPLLYHLGARRRYVAS
jgi:hypothetical protein